MWAGEKARKKDLKQLVPKTALLNLLGAWGRIDNYRHTMITSSHPDDVMWNGPMESQPSPYSEHTPHGGYVFHDVTFKQKVLNLATLLPLNLIGRNQERLQVARALQIVKQCTSVRHVLSIQVDAIYVHVAKRDCEKMHKKFREIRYCDLHKFTPALQKSVSSIKQQPCISKELVFKANVTEPRYPGGELTIADHTDAPYHEDLEWQTFTEPTHGEDVFLDKILEHARTGQSFTVLGAPGVGKTWVLAKIKECLEEELGETVACLAPTHSAARLLPAGDTIHHFCGKYALQANFKGTILLDEISM